MESNMQVQISLDQQTKPVNIGTKAVQSWFKMAWRKYTELGWNVQNSKEGLQKNWVQYMCKFRKQ